MNCTKIFAAAILSTGLFLVTACGNDGAKTEEKVIAADEQPATQPESHGTEVKAGDVTLTTPVNAEWVTAGKSIYELKCQSCHKLTDERLVGPGWTGVTKRREPHWVMNMITNVEMMLETDAEAQKLLEQCLVRMPNQNISKDESRQILEFMRQNDGVK
ncbi:MAG: c-type cytochrome [Bacteroidota bacterium]|nr:c-type cytochrome [Bacteroidota bacterium]